MIVASEMPPLALYAKVGGDWPSPRKNPPGVTLAKLLFIYLLKSSRVPSMTCIEVYRDDRLAPAPEPDPLPGRVAPIRAMSAADNLLEGPTTSW